MSKTYDVAIIGGGVIGLTTAYYLLKEGLSVAVLDKTAFGTEASWAGAGIIQPGNSLSAKSPIDQLRAIGSNLFPTLSEELKSETGIDNGFNRCGILDLTKPETHILEAWDAEGIPYRFVSRIEVEAIVPSIRVGKKGAVLFETGGQVRNPRHLKAIEEACDHRALVGASECKILGINANSLRNRVREIVTLDNGFIRSNHYIICGGAWTNKIIEPFGVQLNVHPVRGQIVLLKEENPSLKMIVEQGKQYIVPRGDGYVLIGSTEEPEAGFVKENTPEGVDNLLTFARAVAPDMMAHAKIERCWSGLRPGSSDGLPTIGRVPGFDNLLIGAGHGRAGIQQSIATAMILRDLVMDRPPMMDISAFRVDRPRTGVIEPLFRS